MDKDRHFSILRRDGSGSGLLSALILHYGIARLLSSISQFVWCTIFLSTVMHSFLEVWKNVIPFSLRLVHYFSVTVLHKFWVACKHGNECPHFFRGLVHYLSITVLHNFLIEIPLHPRAWCTTRPTPSLWRHTHLSSEPGERSLSLSTVIAQLHCKNNSLYVSVAVKFWRRNSGSNSLFGS